MSSVSEDIKDLLIESSSEFGLAFGTDLFIGFLPDSSDSNQVGLFDYSGEQPSPTGITNPVLQILVRGVPGGYVSAWNLIESISNYLHAIANTEIGGTSYIQFWKMGEPSHIGNDEKRRPIFSCTFSVLKS